MPSRVPTFGRGISASYSPKPITVNAGNVDYRNVLHYGATGDGVTDDTAAIQAVIDACVAAGGGTVFFPAGIYLTTGLSVQDAQGVNFQGSSRSASIIKVTGTGNVALNLFSTVGTGGIGNFALRDLKITYSGSGNTGLRLWGASYFTVESCEILSDKLACTVQGSFDGVFSDTQIYITGARTDAIAALWLGSGRSVPHAGTTTLSSAISPGGGALTSLPVHPLPSAIPAGHTLSVLYAAEGQPWTLSAPAAAGATSLAVTSQVPSIAFPVGAAVKDTASTLTASGCGALTFDACNIQAFNGCPATIIEDYTVCVRFQSTLFMARDSQIGGKTNLVGVITIDGNAQAAFEDCYSEEVGSALAGASLFAIGLYQGECAAVRIAGFQATGANSVGVRNLDYGVTVNACNQLDIRDCGLINYTAAAIYFALGYPARDAIADDLLWLNIEGIDNGQAPSSPIYADSNGIIPASYRGPVIRSQFKSFGPGSLGVRATKTGTTSLTSATPAAVPFDSEDFKDAVGAHSNTVQNTRLTCRVPGRYRVYATVVFDTSATGERAVTFQVNSSTLIGGAVGAANPTATASAVTASTTWSFTAGDYVECQALQVSGGPLNVLVASADTGVPTHFGMELV